MREIWFKAKRISDGEWVEGYYSVVPKGKSLITVIKRKCDNPPDCDPMWERVLISHEVDPETVCQYTGLIDKNGKKIFEGDIVKAGEILVVSWKEKLASWCLCKKGWMYNHFFGEAVNAEDCEVIGNIFDNKGLLERRQCAKS